MREDVSRDRSRTRRGRFERTARVPAFPFPQNAPQSSVFSSQPSSLRDGSCKTAAASNSTRASRFPVVFLSQPFSTTGIAARGQQDPTFLVLLTTLFAAPFHSQVQTLEGRRTVVDSKSWCCLVVILIDFLSVRSSSSPTDNAQPTYPLSLQTHDDSRAALKEGKGEAELRQRRGKMERVEGRTTREPIRLSRSSLQVEQVFSRWPREIRRD